MSRDPEQDATRPASDVNAAEAQPPKASKRPWHLPTYEVVDYSITQVGNRTRFDGDIYS